MARSMLRGAALVVLPIVLAASSSGAETPAGERDPGEPYTFEEEGSGRPLIPRGWEVRVGAGVMHFVDRDTRQYVSLGASWEARLILGTRTTLAAELAYVGSAQSIDARGLDGGAALLGSGAETAIRLNVPNVPFVRPFALIGIGVSNYRLINDDYNNSNVDDSEMAVYVPLGTGLAAQVGDFVLDVRATLRPTFQDGLIEDREDQLDEAIGDVAGLDSWSVIASAGFEL